jgi:outer membrane receptor protein involved in Fe transport
VEIAAARRVDPIKPSLLLLIGTAAIVWSARASSSDAAIGDEGMHEILVTAQKRDQKAQDTPMSLHVISSEDIQRTGALDFNTLLLSVPGVSYADSRLGLSNFSIRGISTTATNPTVGTYYDDISLVSISTAFAGAIQPMPVDLDRIEVLKGPQGTLYGGSAMGGAIKYVTKKPVLNRFSVSAGGELGSVDHGGISYGAESFLNLPLVDNQLAVRIGGAYRFDAGYVDNVRNGEVQVWTRSASLPPAPFEPVSFASNSQFSRSDYNSRTTQTARAALLYQPDDAFSMLPVATIQRTYQPNPDEFFTNLPRFQNSNRFDQPEHDNFNLFSLDVTGSIGGVKLTSLTGYVGRTIDFVGDFSLFVGMLTPPLLDYDSYNFSSTNTKTFSQELRASAAMADLPLTWTTGLYYSHQRDYYAQAIDTVGAGDFFGDGQDVIYSTDTLTRTSQKAVFADLTYSPSAQWSLSAGLRWFDIRQRIDGGGNGIANGGVTIVSNRRSTNVGVTPRFAIAYHFTEAQMAYANAAKGFRPGGPNGLGTNSPSCVPSLNQLGLERAPASYQSDSLWSYEVGLKNELPRSIGMLDLALFHSDWKSIQQSITLASCALSFVGNVGAARVDGAELSAEVPVTANFRVGGTIAYTRTKVTRSAVGVDAQVGEELLGTPKSMGSLFGEYRRALTANFFGGLRAEYDYHGANLRQFAAVQPVAYPNGTSGEIPDATQVQAAYHLVNANAFWGNARFQCHLFVDNVLDSAPYLNFRRVPGFSGATTLRPRTIGVRVNTTF